MNNSEHSYNLIRETKRGALTTDGIIVHVNDDRYLITPNMVSSKIVNMCDIGNKLEITTQTNTYIVIKSINHQLWTKQQLNNYKHSLNRIK